MVNSYACGARRHPESATKLRSWGAQGRTQTSHTRREVAGYGRPPRGARPIATHHNTHGDMTLGTCPSAYSSTPVLWGRSCALPLVVALEPPSAYLAEVACVQNLERYCFTFAPHTPVRGFRYTCTGVAPRLLCARERLESTQQ